MDFLADENVPAAIVARLRTDGFNVVAIGEIHAGASDLDVLSVAGRSGSILVTQDRDFGDLVIRQGVPVIGIVLIELAALSPAAQAVRVAECVGNDALRFAGYLTVIEPSRTRQRKLR